MIDVFNSQMFVIHVLLHHCYRCIRPTKCKLPICLGHEGVGEVVETGKDAIGFNVGDRVGLAWLHYSCGQCEFCLQGHETVCIHASCTALNVHGCFREYVVAQATHCFHLSNTVKPEKLARKYDY